MKNFQKGFTLIELLVVISIISLLSSLVLASLTEARKKASNAVESTHAQQYVQALREYFIDHNNYPVGVNGHTTASFCLGKGYPVNDGYLNGYDGVSNWYTGGYRWCGTPWGASSEDDVFDGIIAPYYSSLPISRFGYVYNCTDSVQIQQQGNCKNADVEWVEQGNKTSSGCGMAGSTGAPYYADLNITECHLSLGQI
jgi:prepilin-type N-terminal cleavage/methylation domain-containing protein